MTFPFIYESIGLREDEPGEVLTKEEVLKNASDVSYDQVRVKKVI
jgi:Asp-tRNA(Asn)/Glu-tRNA(Gln) amidotransferase C subunit